MIIPARPVATQAAKSRSTIAPHASVGPRLFHTNFMLIPMAVSASTGRSRSIGTAKTLIEKAKAANRPPDRRSHYKHCPSNSRSE